MYFWLFGRVAEWLGRGLQNLVQRFESARDLLLRGLKKTKELEKIGKKRKKRVFLFFQL